MSELPVPDGVPSAPDDNVTELIRVWWNVDRTAMNIRPVLTDPYMVGEILAELAWHFSNGYAARQGLDRDATLAKIREGWTEATAKIDVAAREQGV